MSSFRQDVNKLREATVQQGDIRQALRDRDETIKGEERAAGEPYSVPVVCKPNFHFFTVGNQWTVARVGHTMRVGRRLKWQSCSLRGLCKHGSHQALLLSGALLV